MNTTIKYDGSVTIKVKGLPPKGSKNSGTDKLFNLITRCLKSGSVQVSDMPTFIDLRKDDSIGVSLLSSLIHITTKDATNNTVSYRGLLTSDMLPTTSLNGINKVYACLLDNSSPRNILAYAELTNGKSTIESIKANPNNQATIQWQMNFSN